MKKPINYKRKFTRLLGELMRDYPATPIGRHLDIAFESYDTAMTPDRELCYALEKYQKELALDIDNIAPDDFVYKIQQDGEHLFDEREEDDELDTYI